MLFRSDGKIRDALGLHLPNFFTELGCETQSAKYVEDDFEKFDLLFQEVLSNSDLIVTTGGTADSQYDLVKPLLAKYKAEILIDRVRMRPGYHVIVARLTITNKATPTYFIALPGNPQSALASMAAVGVKVIDYLYGIEDKQLIKIGRAHV